MKIENISSTVKMLLQTFPDTRDDDNLLILKVWAEENPSIRTKGFSFVDFSKQLLAGNFSSTESIRRCRQKCQQEFPHLRGKIYKMRHAEQEKVKEELKCGPLNQGGTP